MSIEMPVLIRETDWFIYPRIGLEQTYLNVSGHFRTRSVLQVRRDLISKYKPQVEKCLRYFTSGNGGDKAAEKHIADLTGQRVTPQSNTLQRTVLLVLLVLLCPSKSGG